jgi:hypothetical protein
MNTIIAKQEKIFEKQKEKIINKNNNNFKSNRIESFELPNYENWNFNFMNYIMKEGLENSNTTTTTEETTTISEETKETKEITKNIFDEIKALQEKLEKLLEEYKMNNSSLMYKTTEYSTVTGKTNKYSNKNIRFNTGQVCYVTNQGIVKWIPTTEIWDSIAGKQGCPTKEIIDVGIDWKAEYNNAGIIIPTEPPLLSGTPMNKNESCGNAGHNVYVSETNKIGYIDSNGLLSEYDESMIKMSDQYKIIKNTDSAGNDFGGMPMQNSNVEQCKEACSTNETCAGFVFDNTNNNCWLKNKNIYNSSRDSYDGLNLYLRIPRIENDVSCSKQITEIDTASWSNYKKSGRNMTKDTICGLAKVTESSMAVKDDLKTEITNIAKEIIDKINILGNSTTELDSNLEQTKTDLLNSVDIYKKINEEYSKNKETYAVNINGILNDSDNTVLQENYNYMFWSILAIGIIIIIMNLKKKTS